MEEKEEVGMLSLIILILLAVLAIKLIWWLAVPILVVYLVYRIIGDKNETKR